MAGAVRNGRQRANILNSDGQPHPVENFMAVLTLILGLISFILGMIIRNAHTGAAVIVTATATGLVACLVGLYVQMISATREQRIVIVDRHHRRVRRTGPRPVQGRLLRLTAGVKLAWH